jgi:hypothetical protein
MPCSILVAVSLRFGAKLTWEPGIIRAFFLSTTLFRPCQQLVPSLSLRIIPVLDFDPSNSVILIRARLPLGAFQIPSANFLEEFLTALLDMLRVRRPRAVQHLAKGRSGLKSVWTMQNDFKARHPVNRLRLAPTSKVEGR